MPTGPDAAGVAPLPDSVTVGLIHSEEVAYSWHHSLIQMIGYDLGHHQRIIRGGWQAVNHATDQLGRSRNQLVREFLDDPNKQWLWWIDTDMGFAPDTVDRLMAVADPEKAPMVGALCFAYPGIANDDMGGGRRMPRPTLYDWVDQGETRGFASRLNYPVSSVVRVDGTGSACVLIHRSVFEKIREKWGEVWYDYAPAATVTGKFIGEDLSFCMRVGALGLPILIHTGVRTTHLKHVWVSETDFWQQTQVAPATEEVAVLVPVMKRPGNAAPFMRSLRASTGLAKVYAIADHDDLATIAAWRKAGATVLPHDFGGRPGTFAQKVNAGFRASAEPWVLIVGDDVTFHPGWLDQAMAVKVNATMVVGTNDLGNPRVTSGKHATHLLLRRAYVNLRGASWDGPGVLAHEGYRHWYVDDEIVTTAKQRGVWAMALGSIIEHQHPAWGKAEMDDTYRLGMKSAEVDQRLFKKRCAQYLETDRAS